MPDDNLENLLERGVANILPSKELLRSSLEKDPSKLTFYLGIDPTAPFLHLGHTIPARKLEQLRKVGCKVVLLMGGFTATIGDPTDKLSVRNALTLEEVEENSKNYISLLEPVLKINDSENPVEVRNNNEWWNKMSFWEFMNLAKNSTVGQMIERDMFQERIKSGKPIYLHEFIYPLMQGYDSVAMSVDGEVGATDQLFNMLVGRDLLKSFLRKDKFIITVKLLADQTGKKMGKTDGNFVSLTDNPFDMFGKIMKWSDGMIISSFELLTDIDMEEVKKMEQDLSPRDFKAELARAIVSDYHGDEKAEAAKNEFNSVFTEKNVPSDIAEIELPEGEMSPVELLVQTGLAESKNDARRVISQGGLSVDGVVINDENTNIEIKAGSVVQRGKRRFIKLV